MKDNWLHTYLCRVRPLLDAVWFNLFIVLCYEHGLYKKFSKNCISLCSGMLAVCMFAYCFFHARKYVMTWKNCCWMICKPKLMMFACLNLPDDLWIWFWTLLRFVASLKLLQKSWNCLEMVITINKWILSSETYNQTAEGTLLTYSTCLLFHKKPVYKKWLKN